MFSTRWDSQQTQIFKTAVVLALALLVCEVEGRCSNKKNGRSSNCPAMMKIQTWSSTAYHAPPHAAHQTLAIQNRSLAPWENIVSEDPRRLPKRISEARCLTKGCVGLHGGHHEQGEGENLAWRSVPIQVEVMVLRLRRGRCRRKRAIEYQLSSQLITVGCTCVRGRVVRHD